MKYRSLFLLFVLVAALQVGTRAAHFASLPGSDGREQGPPGLVLQPSRLDDLFAQVAQRAPGFGGMYVEGSKLKVHLVHPAQKAATEQAIIGVFGRGRVPATGIEVLQADYTFSQLQNWHESIGSVFAIPGLVFTDIDERANRLGIGVENAAAATAVQAELVRLGVPLAAVNVHTTEPILPMNTLQSTVRPLEGGLQIVFQRQTSWFACTLGFHAVRQGVQGFVTNSHCTAEQGNVTGTEYRQATTSSGDKVGVETVDPPYQSSLCGAISGYTCRWSDSAFVARDSGVTANLGKIARTAAPNTGDLNITGSFTVVSEGTSLVGQTVNKVGRTTGWSQGQVTSTCVNVSQTGSTFLIRCQDFVSANVAGGDSGSPVFAITSGSNVELRGILWGGSSNSFVYSPMSNIQMSSELGSLTTIAPQATPTPTPVPGSTTLTFTPASPSRNSTATVSWTNIPNATTGDWLGLYSTSASNSNFVSWRYLNCTTSKPASPVPNGSCPVPIPNSLPNGTYEFRILANDGFGLIIKSTTFTIGSAPQATATPTPVPPTATPGGPTATPTPIAPTATPAGTTLSVDPNAIPIGGTTTASWSGIVSPTAGDWIGLYTLNAGNGSYLQWIYVSCSQTRGTPRASGSCPFTVPSNLAAGTYELRLFTNDSFTMLAKSNPFSVGSGSPPPTSTTAPPTATSGPATATPVPPTPTPSSGATLTASPTTVSRGSSVTATWSGITSPTAGDWIGLYTPGAGNGSYITWMYVSCSHTKGTARESGSCPYNIPSNLAPGTYQLRLFRNDGFTLITISNNFTVQ